MKKIKFIAFNTFIIVFTAAFFSFAAETKNVPQSASPAKVTTDATKATVQSQAKPAAVSTPIKSAPASTVTAEKATVQSQEKPAPANASTPIKPASVATTANVTSDSKPGAVASPAPVSASASSVPVTAASYNYNPMGKPDPFKPFIETVDKKKSPPKTAAVQKEKPLSIFPLQRAEADKYKVVGIVGNEDQRIAVAEDAAKKHYPLLIGTRIGLHNGKVVEILADRVIVEEYDNNKEKRIILKLRKN